MGQQEQIRYPNECLQNVCIQIGRLLFVNQLLPIYVPGQYEPLLDCKIETMSQEIPSQLDFMKVLRYLVKPIDLVEQYQKEFLTHTSDGAFSLNVAVSEFLEAFDALTMQRLQFGCAGTYDARSPERFVGVGREFRNTPEHSRNTLDLLDHLNEVDDDQTELDW